jgi:hypothetical protein
MQRNLLAGIIGGLALVTFMGLAATAAYATGVDGMGTGGSCPVTGKIGIKPPIAGFPNPDTSPPAALKFGIKGPKGSTCSGGTMDGANLISGKGKGTGMTMHSSCSGLVGPTPVNATIIIKWKSVKGTPKLNTSTVTITSATGGVNTMDGHVTFDASGTVTAGSFNGNSVSAHIEADQTASDLATACNGKGIKKLSFSSPTLSTFTLN